MTVRILWIEGKRADTPSFVPALRRKGYEVETYSTGREALDCLADVDPDLAVLNAASMRTSGKRILHTLRSERENLPIILITSSDNSIEGDTRANQVLYLPFTIRKLLNRIVRLLPGNSDNLLHVGPIRLDMEHGRVSCEGTETRLTPRTAQLLHIFMKHPGEVLEREQLFREVWNTEYTGDTRTLDVHISWLRQAIEAEPRRPRYIKTVRGIGYRLDIY